METAGIQNDYAGGAFVERLNTKTAFVRMPNSEVRDDARFFLNSLGSVFPGLAPLWNEYARLCKEYFFCR